MRAVVAIPAYNEERYVGSVLLRVKKYSGEVILFDDGSTDHTSEIGKLANVTVL
jgi:glycosyltransferase involved in cell wall biosynthesis